MKIAVASDEKMHLTDFVVDYLNEQGHEVSLLGPLADEDLPWTLATEQLADAVANGEAEEEVLFCYTGTGAAMAANKVPVSGPPCAATPRRPAAPAGGTTERHRSQNTSLIYRVCWSQRKT